VPADPLQMSQALFDDRAGSKGEVHGDSLIGPGGRACSRGRKPDRRPLTLPPVRSPCQLPVQWEPTIGKEAAN
jgi:hypothetical protein